MAKISELTVRQGNVDVEGTLKEINEPKVFNKFGRELRVADAILEDDSGSVKISLWNDDVDRFKVGDKVKIINGYVNEFQGEKQLTAGKFGKIEKAGEGEVSEEPSEELKEEPKEESEETPAEEETEEGKSEESEETPVEEEPEEETETEEK